MNKSPLRPLALVACLLVTLAGAPELAATDVLTGNGIGGTTAHGNDGVGGIERAKRMLRIQPGSNGAGPSLVPGGATLPPPPPPSNDLQQDLADDLGGGVTGHSAPSLSPSPEGARLLLQGGQPGAAVVLVLGTSRVDRPFKGGTLVPRPDLVLTGLRLDAQGTLDLSLAPLPAGTELILQAWVSDAGAPAGLAGSNGLSLR